MDIGVERSSRYGDSSSRSDGLFKPPIELHQGQTTTAVLAGPGRQRCTEPMRLALDRLGTNLGAPVLRGGAHFSRNKRRDRWYARAIFSAACGFSVVVGVCPSSGLAERHAALQYCSGRRAHQDWIVAGDSRNNLGRRDKDVDGQFGCGCGAQRKAKAVAFAVDRTSYRPGREPSFDRERGRIHSHCTWPSRQTWRGRRARVVQLTATLGLVQSNSPDRMVQHDESVGFLRAPYVHRVVPVQTMRAPMRTACAARSR